MDGYAPGKMLCIKNVTEENNPVMIYFVESKVHCLLERNIRVNILKIISTNSMFCVQCSRPV